MWGQLELHRYSLPDTNFFIPLLGRFPLWSFNGYEGGFVQACVGNPLLHPGFGNIAFHINKKLDIYCAFDASFLSYFGIYRLNGNFWFRGFIIGNKFYIWTPWWRWRSCIPVFKIIKIRIFNGNIIIKKFILWGYRYRWPSRWFRDFYLFGLRYIKCFNFINNRIICPLALT